MLRRLLVMVVAFLVLILSVEGFFFYKRTQARRAFEAYRDELMRKGEKLRIEEVLQTFPTNLPPVITPEEVVTRLQIVGKIYFNDGYQPDINLSHPVVWWKESQFVNRNGKVETWERFIAELVKAESQIRSLRDVLLHPDGPVSHGGTEIKPEQHWNICIGLINVFRTTIIWNLREGRTERALDDLHLLLDLLNWEASSRAGIESDFSFMPAKRGFNFNFATPQLSSYLGS